MSITTQIIPGAGTGPLILGEAWWGHVRAAEVRHRDFPEIRGEGESPEAALRDLARRLTGVLDIAITRRHREQLERALGDVRSFVSAIGRENLREPSVLTCAASFKYP